MAEYFCKVAEHVRANPTILKHYIFFDATGHVPIFHSYRQMCRKYGSDVMTYPDFEFWFMRFSSGQFDMDYDRSQDTKTRGIQDLPLEIVDKIGKDYLNLMDRQILRKVSRFHRALVNSWDPGFKYISIEIEGHAAAVWYDQYQIMYKSSQIFDGYGYSTSCLVASGDRGKWVTYSDHVDLAIQDLSLILGNPKVSLEKMYIRFNTWNHIEPEIEAKFNKFKQKVKCIAVEIVTSYSRGEMVILPYLHPGTLKNVVLTLKDNHAPMWNDEDFRKRIEQIADLAQCQKAEMMKMTVRGSPSWFPLDKFLGYSHWHLVFSGGDLFTNSEILKWRKTLMKAPNLHEFRVQANTDWKHSTFKKRIAKISEETEHEEIRKFNDPVSGGYLIMNHRNSKNNLLDALFHFHNCG